jgi:hypothetical protein
MATRQGEYGSKHDLMQPLALTRRSSTFAQKNWGPGQMSPMEMTQEEVLRVKLEVLRQEHGDLDAAIRALEAQPAADQLTLRRLKKQKLALKDRISALEDQLTPDIIA